jgi:hypothetical protein
MGPDLRRDCISSQRHFKTSPSTSSGSEARLPLHLLISKTDGNRLFDPDADPYQVAAGAFISRRRTLGRVDEVGDVGRDEAPSLSLIERPMQRHVNVADRLSGETRGEELLVEALDVLRLEASERGPTEARLEVVANNLRVAREGPRPDHVVSGRPTAAPSAARSGREEKPGVALRARPH